MANENIVLNTEQLDTIGEVMNIGMGSAATAVSSMLEKQVTITTPKIEQDKFSNINCSKFEPAIIVRIKYIEGIEGTNVIMLRERDMKIILDLLMGNDTTTEEGDEFEFDEMSMSASCEVMNQMMGASSTALSEVLNRTISISTPEAVTVKSTESAETTFFADIKDSDNVVAISFKMVIDGILDTTFCSFLTSELASNIVSYVNEPPKKEDLSATPEGAQVAQIINKDPYAEAKARMDSESAPVSQPTPPPQPMPPPPQPAASVAPTPPIPTPPPVQQSAPPAQYPSRPAEVTYVAEQPGVRQQQGPVSIKNANFPEFSQGTVHPQTETNMELLMGVQLDVSVVIGKTKRKIRDIADFGQGSVLELNKQTGAPADIVVNGQLIAHGDVIVVGDSFGVRITDIVGTKELMDSLESNM